MDRVKRSTAATIAAICLLTGAGSAWVARGLFDRTFSTDGRIHVINHTEADRRVRLEFPSGESVDLALDALQSKDVMVSKTGEGPIIVIVDEQAKYQVGSLSSLTSPIVLCIEEDAVHFSRIFDRRLCSGENTRLDVVGIPLRLPLASKATQQGAMRG